MRRDKLRRLLKDVGRDPPMTKVALNDIGNPNGVRKQLQAAFEASLRGHESTDKLIGRFRKIVNMSRSRAATIAQTERTRAANMARLKAALEKHLAEADEAARRHRKKPPPPLFQWVNPLTAMEPRHEHVAISGDVQEAGEEFLPGLRFPGDPHGPPHQTINCHCYIRRVVR